MPTQTDYFEFEVTLEDVEPRIWRRFLLRTGATFHGLHDTIQKACGWLDYHLFAFHAVGSREILAVSRHYKSRDMDEEWPDAIDVPLRTFFRKPSDACVYEYDFGDNWEHRVELKSVQRRPGTRRRILLAGARAFPPEDCGGVPGYYECLEAYCISDEELARQDEEVKEQLLATRTWFGDRDPERFDLEACSRQMRRPLK